MQRPSDKPRLYANGQPWKPPGGQSRPQKRIEDEFDAEYAVVDLRRDPPADFLVKSIVREMRIRFYQSKTIASYQSAIVCFLRWYRGSFDQITKDDIREYLDLLVTGGASSSHVSVTLSALRTAFDKFCLLRCTVGLVSPRKPKRLPVVLSKSEVQRVIGAAPSWRDKLLISVLYSTGLRVSEVARLQWADLDFDRRQIRVADGKGRKDRYVMLAEQLLPLLRLHWKLTRGRGFLFPAEGSRTTQRHLSPRTIQRAVDRAGRLSGIAKQATPHAFRHSFATHLIESGTDIRFIQKLLGHTNLETTSIYTKVATAVTSAVSSPLDQIGSEFKSRNITQTAQPASVGRLQISVEPSRNGAGEHVVELGVHCGTEMVSLPGVTVSEPRPGWMNLLIPAAEAWHSALGQLPKNQRERIQSVSFYELLRQEVARRLPRPPD